MKGITQVVGTVLLIGVTVAAVATVSTQIFGLLNSQSPSDVVPDANPGELRVMSCWIGDHQTKLSVRNGQSQKLNTSKLSILVNGSTENFTSSNTIVEPQGTFQIGVKKIFTRNALTKIVAGNGKSANLRCRGIEGSEALRYETSYEGSDSSWSCYSTSSNPSKCTTDATDQATEGTESATAQDGRGLCGYGGVARSFNTSGGYRTLSLDAKVETESWGSAAIMVENSTGVYVIKEWTGGGFSVNKDWSAQRFDISGSGDDFKIIIGNADNSASCNAFDHGFKIWADDFQIE